MICDPKRFQISTRRECPMRSLTRKNDWHSRGSRYGNAKTVQGIVKRVNQADPAFPQVRAKLPGAAGCMGLHERPHFEAQHRKANSMQFVGSDAFSEASYMNFKTARVQRTGEFGKLPLCSPWPQFAGHQHDRDRAGHRTLLFQCTLRSHFLFRLIYPKEILLIRQRPSESEARDGQFP